MEPKSRKVAGKTDEVPPLPKGSPTNPEQQAALELAAATIKGFLREEGVEVEDGGLDSLQAGLEALFTGEAEELEEEDASDGIVVAAEVYKRARAGSVPEEVVMDLAGQRHSLWGHRLWNAARVLADLFDRDAAGTCEGRSVLELGAGAGLPSLICALNGASTVVISDYQNPHSEDSVLVRAIEGNIARLSPSHVPAGVMHAVGYIWGQDLGSIRAPLPPEAGGKFDVIVLADLLFNRTEHDKLLWTCQQCLAERGTAWVAFSHHDPQKADLDLAFFRKAVEAPYDFIVEKVGQEQMQDLFVENDGMDEARGVVYIYVLRKRSATGEQKVACAAPALTPTVASGKS